MDEKREVEKELERENPEEATKAKAKRGGENRRRIERELPLTE